jgi:hypothetical protein
MFPMKAGGAATVNRRRGDPVSPSPLQERCGACGGSCCGRGGPGTEERRGSCGVAALWEGVGKPAALAAGAGGIFQMREDEPAPRVGAGLNRPP